MDSRALIIAKITRLSMMLSFFLLSAVQPQTVILISGVSGSGKTTLCEKIIPMLNEHNKKNNLKNVSWSYISIDDDDVVGNDDDSDAVLDEDNLLDEKEDDDQGENDDLHQKLIEKMDKEIKKGNNVLCDTVIEDPSAYNLYIKKFQQFTKKNTITCLTALLYTPLPVLVDHLHKRNTKAKNEEDKRSLFQVLRSFGEMFHSSDIDYGFGFIQKGMANDFIDKEEGLDNVSKSGVVRGLCLNPLFSVEDKMVAFSGSSNKNNIQSLPGKDTAIIPAYPLQLILDGTKPVEKTAIAFHKVIADCAKSGNYNKNDIDNSFGYHWLKVSK